jgi:hypothetical protein
MAEISTDYQTQVGLKVDGDQFFMKEQGEFKFFDTDYSGATLRNFLRSHYTVTNHALSNDSLFSGPVGSASPFITPCYGYHVISMGAVSSKASVELLSGSLGDIMWIDAAGCASGFSLEFLQLGGLTSVYNAKGSRLSQFYMHMGAAILSIVTPRVKLVCTAESTWSVVEATAGVVLESE